MKNNQIYFIYSWSDFSRQKLLYFFLTCGKGQFNGNIILKSVSHMCVSPTHAPCWSAKLFSYSENVRYFGHMLENLSDCETIGGWLSDTVSEIISFIYYSLNSLFNRKSFLDSLLCMSVLSKICVLLSEKVSLTLEILMDSWSFIWRSVACGGQCCEMDIWFPRLCTVCCTKLHELSLFCAVCPYTEPVFGSLLS